MAANFAALQTTGHNIANANVDGYSRQQAEMATSKGQYSGAGLLRPRRRRDHGHALAQRVLTREAAAAKAQAAGDQARLDQLGPARAGLPAGRQGLGYAAGQLLNSMVDLASRPQDSSTREVVLARAQDVAARFAAAGAQLDNLRKASRRTCRTASPRSTELSQRIADVNDQISRTRLGQTPNDLLDQRDQLVADLSSTCR
jgi:flagellar hook-associated protein 1 FlgK